MRKCLIAVILLCAVVVGADNSKDARKLGKAFSFSTGKIRIPLHINTGKLQYPAKFPVSGGVPLPPGKLKTLSHVRVTGSDGHPVTAQFKMLAYWPDKSVKWLLVEFQLQRSEENPVYYLEFGPAVNRPTGPELFPVRTGPASITVDTGKIRAVISKTGGSLIDELFLDLNQDGKYSAAEKVTGGPVDSYVELRDIEGNRSGMYLGSLDREAETRIENHGPESVTILKRLWHKDKQGRKSCPVDVRITFYRSQSFLRIYHTFLISENCSIILFPSFGIKVPYPGVSRLLTGIDGKTLASSKVPFTAFQDSAASGWYPKFNEFDPVCLAYRGQGVADDAGILGKGKKADGWLQLVRKRDSLTVELKEMWQNFPKAFTYTDKGCLRVEFWPYAKDEAMNMRRFDQGLRPDYTRFMEGESKKIRGYKYNMLVYHRQMTQKSELVHTAFGMGKSHDLKLDFTLPGADGRKLAELMARPLLPFVSGEWNSYTGALGPFMPRDEQDFPKTEASWDNYHRLLKKHQQDWFNWYGMWHWGDFQTYYFPKSPFGNDRWGNFNTKYGWRNGGFCIPFGIMMRYLRSGKQEDWDWARQVAEKHMDVSSSHPRAWSEQRLVKAKNCVNNSKNPWQHDYWSLPWVGGGIRYNSDGWGTHVPGYDSQHSWIIGTALYYYLTGNERARDVAKEYIRAVEGKSRHFKMPFGEKTHDRREDMSSGIAAVAFELDPDNPRYRKLRDVFAGRQARGMKSITKDAQGKWIYGDNRSAIDWHFKTYKGINVMYLLGVKNDPELVQAVIHAAVTGNPVMNALAYHYTGNPNYAKRAAMSIRFTGLDRAKKMTRKVIACSAIFGYDFLSQYYLLKAMCDAKLDFMPGELDASQRMRYPDGAKGLDNISSRKIWRFVPVDIRKYCNYKVRGEYAIAPANQDFKRGTVKFDFGPLSSVEPGWLPADARYYYPANASQRDGVRTLAAMPFGTMVRLKNVDFALVEPDVNHDLGAIALKGETPVTIPVNRKAAKIYLLTGIALANNDILNNRPGMEYVIEYADGTAKRGCLENFTHYQAWSILPRMLGKKFYAGTPTSYHLSVVGIDTGGKKIKTISLKNGKDRMKPVVLALSVEDTDPLRREFVYRDRLPRGKGRWKGKVKKDYGCISSGRTFEYSGVGIPNGNYLLEIVLEVDPVGCPVDVSCNGVPVVRHACLTSKTTCQIPVSITDKKLRLRIIPGQIHTKSKCYQGVAKLYAVNLCKLPAWNFLPVKGKTGEAGPQLTYGWKLKGNRSIIREAHLKNMNRQFDKFISSGNLMEDDEVFRVIDHNVYRGEFVIDDVPPGEYEVILYMRNLRGDSYVDLQAENRKFAKVRLSSTRILNHYRMEAKVAAPFKFRVPVKDGQFNLIITLPKAYRGNYRSWSIAGLELRRIK